MSQVSQVSHPRLEKTLWNVDEIRRKNIVSCNVSMVYRNMLICCCKNEPPLAGVTLVSRPMSNVQWRYAPKDGFINGQTPVLGQNRRMGDDPGNDIENRIVRFSISYSTIREIVYYDLPNPKLGFSESYSTIFSIVLLHCLSSFPLSCSYQQY